MVLNSAATMRSRAQQVRTERVLEAVKLAIEQTADSGSMDLKFVGYIPIEVCALLRSEGYGVVHIEGFWPLVREHYFINFGEVKP